MSRKQRIRQRVKAQKQRQRNSLTAPITDPKDVRREVRAAANLEFRPLARQLQGEVRASRQRERDIGRWYGQAGRQIRRITRATNKDYRRTGNQVRKDIRSATGMSALANAALNQQDAELAKLTGATYDPSASQTSSAAAAQRALLQTALGGMLRTQGASQRGYLRGQRVSAKREGLYQRGQEAKRRQSIRDDQRELKKARGEFAVEYRGNLRDKERDYKIERMAFSTPSQYDRTVRQQSRAGLQEARIHAGATRYQADRSLQEQRARNRGYRNLPRGGGGDEGGGISEREAMGYLRQSVPKGGYKSRAQAVDILVNRGVDAKTARRVVNRAFRRQRGGGGGRNDPPPTYTD